MSRIDELESRITQALDRIGQGVGTLAERQGGDPEEVERLRLALEDEKLANAQLEERVRTLKQKLADAGAEERAELEQVKGMVKSLDAELQRMHEVNRQLRDNNAALREANAEGVGEPHLINSAMRGELEALKAERDAESAQARAALAALEPLLNNLPDADETAEEENV